MPREGNASEVTDRAPGVVLGTDVKRISVGSVFGCPAGLLCHPREHDGPEPIRVAFAPVGEFDDAPGYPEPNDLIAVEQAEFGEESMEGRTHDGAVQARLTRP